MSQTGRNDTNSKYAWHQFTRQGLPKRPASERVADFLEIYGLYDEATAREQASRCIQCPNPSCVMGCPLCNPIPEWMLLTAEGRFLEAAAVLGSVTNMAEICARICPTDHLCEGACILESISEPVSIRAIEQFLIEYAFDHGRVDATTAPPNGLRVALLGSGPGGLACADELARKGYSVSIFDSDLVPGGLLVNGVPAFRLEQSIVERRINVLKKRGVVFCLGLKPGKDVTLAQLKTGFDAVFIGMDSRAARPLEIPGAELEGVVQALPFLLQKKSCVPLKLPPMDLRDKRVVVLGGGDTAMDCLRTAIRYGAREALCVYRRGEREMPCSKQEYCNAREEGARFLFQAAPLAVLGRGTGSVSGLRLVRTRLEPSGTERERLGFSTLQGTEFEIDADWVIPALGFMPTPCPFDEDFNALAKNHWGGLTVDSNLMTSMAGVFAGGDLVRGPSPILYAVRDGRLAAARIHSFLNREIPSRAVGQSES